MTANKNSNIYYIKVYTKKNTDVLKIKSISIEKV